MKDVMVSIRIPDSLVEELKKSPFYMDISEQIRDIVRDQWIASKNPELLELQKLKTEIQEELKKKSQKLITSELLKELEELKDSIKGGAK